MDVVDGFAQQGGHGNNLQFGAAFQLVAQGDGIRDKNL